ncbi:DNA glycosylase [Xylariaceae sp. FL0594]|nr:DNA glycosylase [Xylariaceae sp. FL0594]
MPDPDRGSGNVSGWQVKKRKRRSSTSASTSPLPHSSFSSSLMTPEPRRSKRIRENAAARREAPQVDAEAKHTRGSQDGRANGEKKAKERKKGKEDEDAKLAMGEDQVPVVVVSPPPPTKSRSSRSKLKPKSESVSNVEIKLENSEGEDGYTDVRPREHGGKDTKVEEAKTEVPSLATVKAAAAAIASDLQAKKLRSYAQFAGSRQSPYPDFARPRPEECKLAYKILADMHGEQRQQPSPDFKAPTDRAGCGDSPSVLDALVRTILSQNTSDRNSARAKLSMDAVYGSSDAWDAIVAGGQPKLQKAIESGGLAAVKSRVILDILEQTHDKYGEYSLDHLFDDARDDTEAMRELLSFKGVGPKTASCVLLFCLRRPSFAVDTHVHRITGFLGWRPPGATRDQTYAHLDARIPDEDKYGLHVLMVKHGKVCGECKAGGGRAATGDGSCELRKAFRKGKIKGEAGQEAKEEELDS